jgi:hypothetical protein
MADIFVSYAQEDEERAGALASALRQEGWSVFRDRRIPPGQRWDEYIGQELAAAKCVVVLWSDAACASNWVLEEAEDARQRGVLVPALIEARLPPLGFRRIQAADLIDWHGGGDHQQFRELVAAIRLLTPAMSGDAGVDEQPSPAPERVITSPAALRSTSPESEIDWKAQPLEQVFLASPFTERDRNLASDVAMLLSSHEIAVVTSEEIPGPSISDAVRQRIAQADGTIALLTRREELEAGGWTTPQWVVDELLVAEELGKPAVALVEEGVHAPLLLSGDTQFGTYRSGDFAEALLELSGVVGYWKSRAGRVIKATIQTREVVEALFGAAASACHYRFFLEGEFSDWRAAAPIALPDGAALYLAVPHQAAGIQVEVSGGGTTWRSPVVAESVPIQLSRT